MWEPIAEFFMELFAGVAGRKHGFAIFLSVVLLAAIVIAILWFTVGPAERDIAQSEIVIIQPR